MNGPEEEVEEMRRVTNTALDDEDDDEELALQLQQKRERQQLLRRVNQGANSVSSSNNTKSNTMDGSGNESAAIPIGSTFLTDSNAILSQAPDGSAHTPSSMKQALNSLTWSDVMENPRHLLKMEVFLFHYKLRNAIRQGQEHVVELMFELMKERQSERNEKRRRKRKYQNSTTFGGESLTPNTPHLNNRSSSAGGLDDDHSNERDPTTCEAPMTKIPLSSRSTDSSNPYVSLEIQLDLLPNEPCPLHVACEVGHQSIVQLALKYYHVNTIDPVTHKTPLHVAIENEQKQIAILLCKCGAHVSFHSDTVESPLTASVYVGSESLVEMLLFQFKANPNDEYKDIRYSPMYACCKMRNMLIFEILRKAGCNVDCTGGHLQQTALHQLIQDRDLDGCRMILEKKKYRADMFLEDRNGFSAIHIAASSSDFPEMIRLLIKFGANPDLRSTAVGRITTPLSLAVSNGFFKTAQVLVALGADIDRPMNSGKFIQEKRTVLSHAVELGNEDIVSLFLRHGADIETPISRTPLYLACKMGLVGITKLLLDAGANTEVVDVKRKFTPLMIATKRGHEKIVRLLLKYKCNVNHLSIDHETALHVAARRGSARIVTDLLKYKVDANMKNESRQTALHISCEEKHFDIVEILLRWNITAKKEQAKTTRENAATAGGNNTITKRIQLLKQQQERSKSPQKLVKKVRGLITPVKRRRKRPQWRHSTMMSSTTNREESSLFSSDGGGDESMAKLPPLFG